MEKLERNMREFLEKHEGMRRARNKVEASIKRLTGADHVSVFFSSATITINGRQYDVDLRKCKVSFNGCVFDTGMTPDEIAKLYKEVSDEENRIRKVCSKIKEVSDEKGR